MKVFISADIEGICGATNWDETNKDKADYRDLREQMTAEVAAACEGALSAGAGEVWVRDAHWTATNIQPAKLPRQVKIVREWSGHPFSMMQELDDSFQAVLMIGYHSRAGSNTSPLAHTMSGNIISLKINDRFASEFLIAAYTAGLVKVPVAFLSGDAGICQEASSFLPALGTVAVTQGTGRSTVSIHPALAVEQIRSGVEAALKRDLAPCRVDMPRHFQVELSYRNHASAFRASFYPAVQQTDSHSVSYESDDYFEVLRFFAFCMND